MKRLTIYRAYKMDPEQTVSRIGQAPSDTQKVWIPYDEDVPEYIATLLNEIREAMYEAARLHIRPRHMWQFIRCLRASNDLVQFHRPNPLRIYDSSNDLYMELVAGKAFEIPSSLRGPRPYAHSVYIETRISLTHFSDKGRVETYWEPFGSRDQWEKWRAEVVRQLSRFSSRYGSPSVYSNDLVNGENNSGLFTVIVSLARTDV